MQPASELTGRVLPAMRPATNTVVWLGRERRVPREWRLRDCVPLVDTRGRQLLPKRRFGQGSGVVGGMLHCLAQAKVWRQFDMQYMREAAQGAREGLVGTHTDHVHHLQAR